MQFPKFPFLLVPTVLNKTLMTKGKRQKDYPNI